MRPLCAVVLVCRSKGVDGACLIVDTISAYVDPTPLFDALQACSSSSSFSERLLERVLEYQAKVDLLTNDPVYQQWQFNRCIILAARASNESGVWYLLYRFPALLISQRSLRAVTKAGFKKVISHLVEKGRVTNTHGILTSALRYGQFSIATWLHERANDDTTVIQFYVEYVITAAKFGRAADGQLASALRHLETLAPSSSACSFAGIALQSAVMTADIETLKALLLFRCGNRLAVERVPLVTAVVCGRLDVITFISNCGPVFTDCFKWDMCLEVAAESGRLDLVMAVFATLKSMDDSSIRYRVDYALQAAANVGHFKVVKYLYNNANSIERDIIGSAVSSGHLSIAKWLHAQNDFPANVPFCSQDAVDSAVARGHLPVLKWLGSFRDTFSCSQRMAHYAAASGHLNTLKWVYKTKFVSRTRLDRSESASFGIDMSAASGHMAVVQWLHGRGQRCSPGAMDCVAGIGNLSLLQWMHDRGYVGTRELMNYAAINGHLRVCQWIYRNQRERCSAQAVQLVIDSDQLSILRWMYATGMLGDVANAVNWKLNTRARLATMKWLIRYTPTVYTAVDMIQLAGYGHMEALKWMHAASGGRIFAPQVVMEAVAIGDLAIVRWLHAKFPLNPVWSIDLMEFAMCQRHWHVAAFLRHIGIRCKEFCI